MEKQFDFYYGRILAYTAGATDTYAELQIGVPQVVSGGTKNSLWVPVFKQADFEWVGAVQGISADCALNAALMLGESSLYSAISSVGVADPNSIANWHQIASLTTSGQVAFDCVKSIILPGSGIIVTAPFITLIQSNTATGVALNLACRIWYDYVAMDEMTYMRSLHGMNG